MAYVKVNIIKTNDSSPKYYPKKIYRHPRYDDWTLANDVALIELDRPVEGVQPIKLAKPSLVSSLQALFIRCLLSPAAGWHGMQMAALRPVLCCAARC